MFHFPGCPPHELCIHSWVTGHCPGRVPPFGYPWIDAYLRLPMAFRSLSRPSSAISALASTLRSYSLDLASIASPFLRLLRRIRSPLICRSATSASDWILPLPLLRSRFFPVQFSRCARAVPASSEAPLSRTLKTIQRFEFQSVYIIGLTGSVRLRFRFRLPSPCRPSVGLCLFRFALPLDLGFERLSPSPSSLPRKEVIQPHLPIRLPCYDFTPLIGLTFGSWLLLRLPH